MKFAPLAALALVFLTPTARAQTPPAAAPTPAQIVVTISTLDFAAGEFAKLSLPANRPKVTDGLFATFQKAAADAHLPLPLTRYPGVVVGMGATGFVPVNVDVPMTPPGVAPPPGSAHAPGPGDIADLQLTPGMLPDGRIGVRLHFVDPPAPAADPLAPAPVPPVPPAVPFVPTPSSVWGRQGVSVSTRTETVTRRLLNGMAFRPGETRYIAIIEVKGGPTRVFYATVTLPPPGSPAPAVPAAPTPTPAAAPPAPAAVAPATLPFSFAVTALDLSPDALRKLHLPPLTSRTINADYDAIEAASLKYHVAVPTTQYPPVTVAPGAPGYVHIVTVFPKKPRDARKTADAARMPPFGEDATLEITAIPAADGKTGVALSLGGDTPNRPSGADSSLWPITRLGSLMNRAFTPGETYSIGVIQTDGGPYRFLFAAVRITSATAGPVPRGTH